MEELISNGISSSYNICDSVEKTTGNRIWMLTPKENGDMIIPHIRRKDLHFMTGQKGKIQMRIINLIENTEGTQNCAAAHGLSFYLETAHHRVLVDLGPSGETLKNAEKLGVDLTAVDTVILSHGHYDHSGGIPAFAEINPNAKIYMQHTAAGDYYSDDGPDGDFRYIGIDKRIADLPQTVLVDGDWVIDDELRLFTVSQQKHAFPATNSDLYVKAADGRYIRDNFVHEQSLIITEGERTVLLSGCAHNGIRNILAEFRRKFGREPDAVISGFHLMKDGEYTDEEIGEIIDTAKELKESSTRFYTCHCTGLPAYRVMKSIMGDQLEYVHCGDTVQLHYRNNRTIEKGKGEEHI